MVAACIGHPGCSRVNRIAPPTVGKENCTGGVSSTLEIDCSRLGALGLSVSAQNQPMLVMWIRYTLRITLEMYTERLNILVRRIRRKDIPRVNRELG